jgi:esterase/lipase superfamily enzyme
VKFDHVVLAAPDIDAGVFLQLADHFVKAAGKTTLYASSNDRALSLSKKFHGSPRAGDILDQRPVVVGGVDTIDASELDTDLLGHSYYGDHKSVVSDLFYLLQGITPEKRFGLVQQQCINGLYWKFSPGL